MSSAFSAENMEFRDIGTFYNKDSDAFDTQVHVSLDEDDELSIVFDDDNGSALALSLPIERLKRLLELERE